MTYVPIPYATPLGPPPLENGRRGGLIAFGVISILIGSAAGCMTVGVMISFFMIGSMMVGASLDMPVSQMIAALAMYAAAAVLFVWAGIDSIRCRRWVRPVAISVGWIAIIGTLFGIATMLMFLGGGPPLLGPHVTTVTSTSGTGSVVVSSTTSAGPPTVGMLIATIIGMVLLGLIVPSAFVWFYSTQAVKLTLEAYQPEPSWTERCPLPIFLACAALLLGGFSTAMMAFTASTPFFGIYLEGLPAVALILLSAGVMFGAMVLMYRMKVIGWWMAFAVIALGFTSAIMTFSKLGMLEFYQRGHASASDIAQLTSSPAAMGIMPIVVSGVMGVVCLGYLIWVHRYFQRNQLADQP